MMELSVLNAGVGDYKAEFDTDDERARDQLEGFIADMLVKGYALFLEDGNDTHRILSYDAGAKTFDVVSAQTKSGRATIRVSDGKDAAVDAPSPTQGKPRGGRRGSRVTAVAPAAGG